MAADMAFGIWFEISAIFITSGVAAIIDAPRRASAHFADEAAYFASATARASSAGNVWRIVAMAYRPILRRRPSQSIAEHHSLRANMLAYTHYIASAPLHMLSSRYRQSIIVKRPFSGGLSAHTSPPDADGIEVSQTHFNIGLAIGKSPISIEIIRSTEITSAKYSSASAIASEHAPISFASAAASGNHHFLLVMSAIRRPWR